MTDSDTPTLARVWLTVEEVVQMTGVSRTETYAALQTGDLEGNQRGKHKRWRIHIDAMNRWMEGSSATRRSA
jgi:excisionase family DNA binding protein